MKICRLSTENVIYRMKIFLANENVIYRMKICFVKFCYFSATIPFMQEWTRNVISFPDLLWTKPKARSGKVRIFLLAAPFDSFPILSLKTYAVFRGKLSSNSSSNLEISAVSEKEKPIRKDERRKNLEVICHSELNNFCNMIVPLPNSQTRNLARAQAPLHLPHMLFWHSKTLQTPPPVRSFFFALTRSPTLRTKTTCRELIPEAV